MSGTFPVGPSRAIDISNKASQRYWLLQAACDVNRYSLTVGKLDPFGFFAAGNGADFSGSPSQPLPPLQLSFSPRGNERSAIGTWRLYGWHNPQAAVHMDLIKEIMLT